MKGVHITLRMRLFCEIFRDGEPIEGQQYEVLNEVVVDRGANPFLTKIECFEKGRLITKVGVQDASLEISSLPARGLPSPCTQSALVLLSAGGSVCLGWSPPASATKYFQKHRQITQVGSSTTLFCYRCCLIAFWDDFQGSSTLLVSHFWSYSPQWRSIDPAIACAAQAVCCCWLKSRC